MHDCWKHIRDWMGRQLRGPVAIAAIALLLAGLSVWWSSRYVETGQSNQFLSGLLSNVAVGFLFVAIVTGVVEILLKRSENFRWRGAAAMFEERLYLLVADTIVALTETAKVTTPTTLHILLESAKSRRDRRSTLMANVAELVGGRVLPQSTSVPLTAESEESLRFLAVRLTSLRHDCGLLLALAGRQIAPSLHTDLLELHDRLGLATLLLTPVSTLAARFENKHGEIRDTLSRIAGIAKRVIEQHTEP